MFLASNPIIDSYFQSDLFGKGIFLSLFLLSVITWVIFLKKIFYIKNIRSLALEIKNIFLQNEQKPLSLEIRATEHPFSEAYSNLKKKAIELLNKNRLGEREGKAYLFAADISLLDTHLLSVISSRMTAMEKDLFVLSTIISLAPFLGLLGTVWGILLTFSQMNGHFADKSSVIMSGLSMALGTTIVGLLVAIPALIAYNYLKSALTRFETMYQDFGTLLLSSLEFQYRKIDNA